MPARITAPWWRIRSAPDPGTSRALPDRARCLAPGCPGTSRLLSGRSPASSPHLQLAISLGACNEGLRADAGEELLDGFGNLLRLRRLCPFLCPVDRVGPALDDLGIRTDVFVGRHEGRIVGRTDGLPDRGKHVALAVHLELRRVRVNEDGILVLAREPRAHP